MKLISAKIQNYRTHRETTVCFDGSLVLIHGPNESGKSTLAEAIHRALFLKATTGGKIRESMVSSHGGHPTVEFIFNAQGKEHRLEKRFSGTSGSATLSTRGMPDLSGDAAEEALSKILQVEGAISGNGAEAALKNRWAHLWVWQGSSSDTPLDCLEDSHAQLRAKLQAQSGQDILSSPADSAVIDALTRWGKANVTQSGSPKSGSELKQAIEKLEAAEARAQEAQRNMDELEEAAGTFEQASADIERHRNNHQAATVKLKEIREKLQAVSSLREQLKEKTRQRESAEKTCADLETADEEIRTLEKRLKTAEASAAPLREQLTALRTEAEQRRTETEDARKSREVAAQSLAKLRGITDAWQAHREHLNESKQMAGLNKQLKNIEKLKEKEKELRQKLAPLERYTPNALKKLKQAERKATEAQHRLEAYALRVELLESSESVTLNSQKLASGEEQILSEIAELQVGQHTRIRLNPGGAEDLADARKTADAEKNRFEQALQSLAVRSIDEAQTDLQTKENLEKDLKQLEQKLKDADSEGLNDALSTSECALHESAARRDACCPADSPIDFPEDLKATEAAYQHAWKQMKAAEDENSAKEKAESAAHKALDKADQALSKASKKAETQSDTIKKLESQLSYALSKNGDTDSRSKAINQARAAMDKAKTAEKDQQDQLTKLGADQLEIDEKRLNESAESDAKKLKEAEGHQIEARTKLQSSGTQDPERELKEAVADVNRCRKTRDRLQHQTHVRLHLLKKLRYARQATTAALAKPLEDNVTPYLRLLFGGSRAQLSWSEDGSALESLTLDRSERSGGSVYSFKQLSHGTREQVALALRLAMAQLLATDHDNCLPLVLDDAFTHADPERLEKLKSLLYRASESGLQIILLSCHPENYSGLSASEAPLASQTAAQPTASAAENPTTA